MMAPEWEIDKLFPRFIKTKPTKADDKQLKSDEEKYASDLYKEQAETYYLPALNAPGVNKEYLMKLNTMKYTEQRLKRSNIGLWIRSRK